MDCRVLVGKIAADKNNTTLGRIVRIDKLLGKTIKVYKSYIIVLVDKRFKKDVLVPIDCELLLNTEGEKARFSITKEEFDEEEKRIRLIRTEKSKFQGVIPERTTAQRNWVPMDRTGTSYKVKEKKR
ncbi:MAG: hypothetical protein JXA54_17115 [Candidatus Heimdallarchaeota archaeon]|nr:hypothetical protein [Candidatus Heimdallarchaeota archaeon]